MYPVCVCVCVGGGGGGGKRDGVHKALFLPRNKSLHFLLIRYL